MEQTEEKLPPITVHQIWLGNELPIDLHRRYVENTKRVCEKAGMTHKLWRMTDLLSSFPRDAFYHLWSKLFSHAPYPPIFSAAVDFFKWKVLAQTPKTEVGVYLDLDVELRTRRGKKFALPYPDAYITFGAAEFNASSPSTAYIHVYGPEAASVGLKEAEKVLSLVDLDSPTFFTDFLSSALKAREDSPLCLRERWLKEKVIPELEKEEWLAEVAPLDIFANYGQSDKPLLLHHSQHFIFDGKKEDGEIKTYMEEVEKEVLEVQKGYKEKEKKVILLMSGAREYDESLNRTLGLITSENIRDVQRRTTFSRMSTTPEADYYFVLGQGEGGLGEKEKDSPEFYFSPEAEGKDRVARRMYDAMKWTFENLRFEFLLFCSDDNYIHLPRLISFCHAVRANEEKVYGHTDEEGRATQAGILVPSCVARKIILANLDAPRLKEDFGSWMKHALEAVGGEFIEDDKFSYTKGNYPAPSNGRITTHEVNPFDLVLLSAMNEG